MVAIFFLLFPALFTRMHFIQAQVTPPALAPPPASKVSSRAKADTQRVIVLERADTFGGMELRESPEMPLSPKPPVSPKPPTLPLPERVEQVRYAVGNVLFREATSTVECDSAVDYPVSRKIHVIGNVKIVRDTVTIRGKEGFYFQDARRSELKDSVSLTDERVRLTSNLGIYFSDEQKAIFSQSVILRDIMNTVYSDSLIYFRALKKSIVLASPKRRIRILNRSDNVLITGGYAEHYTEAQRSFIEKEPVLVQVDTTDRGKRQPDSLVIRASRMEAFRSERDTMRRVDMTDSVRIRRGELLATSRRALYLFRENKLILTGNPIVWYQDTQLTGDSMVVQLRETQSASGKRNRLEKIFIYQNAFLLSKDSLDKANQKFNQVSGKNLFITFDDSSRIQQADVYIQARSIYYTYDEATASGANSSSGDEISIVFRGNKASRIVVRGGVEGEQYPERLTVPAALNLPGFARRDAEKPKE